MSKEEETQQQQSDLEKDFELALKFVNSPSDGSVKLSNDTKLKFYAFYKQIKEGPNNTPQPSRFKFIERAKWDAWKKLGNMSKEDAMKGYIQALDDEYQKAFPGLDWRNSPQVKGSSNDLKSKL